MTVLALIVGVALGWAAKDTAVWSLAEAVRYWHGEALAAERDLRHDGRGRVPFERLRARRPGAVPTHVARSLVVRVALRDRPPWRPAPWPGWGQR